jgi:glyoxylase-like metal-dependent hydrolase (beta-lactamase superfamily II)
VTGTGSGTPAPGDWTEPGAYAVAPGVFRIPLPLPHDALRAVNAYAIAGGDEVALIDGGWALAESEALLERALGQLGRDLGAVTGFYVTHAHRDHYTQAVAVRRRLGTRVALGVGERPNLRRLQGPYLSSQAQLELLVTAGAGDLAARIEAQRPRQPVSDGNWADPDDWLADQQAVELPGRTLTVIPTPGHTRGHVIFADRAAGLAFTGDHVLPHITPSIGFEPAPPRQPLLDFLASLALVRSLPEARMLPAHGPAGASVHRRVDELLAHHDDRLDACARAVETGARTAFEAAGRLRWTRRERRLAELDAHNQLLAVLETMAHLDVLVIRGRLTAAASPAGATYYSLLTAKTNSVDYRHSKLCDMHNKFMSYDQMGGALWHPSSPRHWRRRVWSSVSALPWPSMTSPCGSTPVKSGRCSGRTGRASRP